MSNLAKAKEAISTNRKVRFHSFFYCVEPADQTTLTGLQWTIVDEDGNETRFANIGPMSGRCEGPIRSASGSAKLDLLVVSYSASGIEALAYRFEGENSTLIGNGSGNLPCPR